MAMLLKSKDAGVIIKSDVRCIIDCFKHNFGIAFTIISMYPITVCIVVNAIHA